MTEPVNHAVEGRIVINVTVPSPTEINVTDKDGDK